MFSGTLRDARPAAFGRRRQTRRRSPRSACSTAARPSSARRSPPGRSAKLWGLGDVRIGDAIGEPRARPRAEHQFAPPTLETVVVPAPPRRQGRAARRARPARRAGSADQPAAGRRPAGALRVALRRGAEGGHPGDAGRRLRHRGRVPRDDDDLHRAAGRHRRGRRAHRHDAQPVPRDRRAARRAGAGRLRRASSGSRSSSGSMPLAFFNAVEDDRARDAAAGPPRLAGPRLHGHDDPFGLLAATEPRARRFDKSMSSTAATSDTSRRWSS